MQRETTIGILTLLEPSDARIQWPVPVRPGDLAVTISLQPNSSDFHLPPRLKQASSELVRTYYYVLESSESDFLAVVIFEAAECRREN